MSTWRSLLKRLGLTEAPLSQNEYRWAMDAALTRLRLAEIQLREAATLEQLDLGRTAMQQALAEVQHLVRQAKADRGIPLRSIAETEEMYQRMLVHITGRKRPRRTADRPQVG